MLDAWLAELTQRLDKARSRGIDPAPFSLGLTVHSTNARLKDDLASLRQISRPARGYGAGQSQGGRGAGA